MSRGFQIPSNSGIVTTRRDEHLTPLAFRRGVGGEAVYLVDENQHGHAHLSYFFDEIGIFVGRFHHISHVKQHIGILQGALGEMKHLLLQLVVRLEHTGGVGEADLHLWRIEYAHNAVARSLCLEGGNRDALAHEEVHERGLAHIRVAYYIYETGFVHLRV